MAGGLMGSGRGRNSRKRGLVAEINVTPLVDVMLVLLVIFMATAPLVTVSVPVDLPKTKAAGSNQSG
jgi:biopolymer transport protein TolR